MSGTIASRKEGFSEKGAYCGLPVVGLSTGVVDSAGQESA